MLGLGRASASLIAERDELLAQRGEWAAHRDRLTAESRQLTRQINSLIAQNSALSTISLERDRFAAALAGRERGDGAARSDRDSSGALDRMRSRYLDLVEAALIGSITDDPPLPTFGATEFDASVRNRGLDWPRSAFSMIGAARMRNFRLLVEKAILNGTRGDIVETGVWRGGASIMARAVLASYEIDDRKVILADSFEGLPPPREDEYPADANSVFHQYSELAVSLDTVKVNFAKFGLLDEQVVFVKGWFKDTMQTLPAREIAVLRLDGDMYESTIQPLTDLYDRVSPGGWIIVDDYEWVPACKAAVDDFLASRSIKADILQIDGVGVFFQKNP